MYKFKHEAYNQISEVIQSNFFTRHLISPVIDSLNIKSHYKKIYNPSLNLIYNTSPKPFLL